MNAQMRSLWAIVIALLAGLGLAAAWDLPSWAACIMGAAAAWDGIRQWRRLRPGAAALAIAAAAAAALARRADLAAAALAVAAAWGAELPQDGASRLLRTLAAAALGLATATWALRGPGPALGALTAACAAAALLRAADAAVTAGMTRAGVMLSGPEAMRAGASVDGVVLSRLPASPPARASRASVLAARHDRSRALAIAASLLAGTPDAAVLRAAAASAGLPQRAALDVQRHAGGEVVGLCDGCVACVGPVEILARRGFAPSPSLSRRSREHDGPAYGVAWGGRVRALVLVGSARVSAEPLRALGCEVWRRGGPVVPLRRRADEDAFAIADMLARGRHVAVVCEAGGVAPAADLTVQIGGAVRAGAGPTVILPEPDLGRLAAFLRTARRTRRLHVLLGCAAILLGGPGVALAAAGWMPPAAAAWAAVAAAATGALLTAMPGKIFTSSQRNYA